MSTFEKKLNALLIHTLQDILKVEELILRKSDPHLSINEVHLIESVRNGNKRSRTVSGIALDLQLAVPSVTIAVNKLVRKGYLVKKKNKEDGRSVLIKLTREGEKIYRLHRYIHLKLVRAAAQDLTDEEKEALLIGIKNLDHFFKKRIAKYGGINEFSNYRDGKSPSDNAAD